MGIRGKIRARTVISNGTTAKRESSVESPKQNRSQHSKQSRSKDKNNKTPYDRIMSKFDQNQQNTRFITKRRGRKNRQVIVGGTVMSESSQTKADRKLNNSGSGYKKS